MVQINVTSTKHIFISSYIYENNFDTFTLQNYLYVTNSPSIFDRMTRHWKLQPRCLNLGMWRCWSSGQNVVYIYIYTHGYSQGVWNMDIVDRQYCCLYIYGCSQCVLATPWLHNVHSNRIIPRVIIVKHTNVSYEIQGSVSIPVTCVIFCMHIVFIY